MVTAFLGCRAVVVCEFRHRHHSTPVRLEALGGVLVGSWKTLQRFPTIQTAIQRESRVGTASTGPAIYEGMPEGLGDNCIGPFVICLLETPSSAFLPCSLACYVWLVRLFSIWFFCTVIYTYGTLWAILLCSFLDSRLWIIFVEHTVQARYNVE